MTQESTLSIPEIKPKCQIIRQAIIINLLFVLIYIEES
jgi:hypothetical protein